MEQRQLSGKLRATKPKILYQTIQGPQDKVRLNQQSRNQTDQNFSSEVHIRQQTNLWTLDLPQLVSPNNGSRLTTQTNAKRVQSRGPLQVAASLMTSQEIINHHKLLSQPEQNKPVAVNIKSNLIRAPPLPPSNQRFRIAKPSTENQNNYSYKLMKQSELQRVGSAGRSGEHRYGQGTATAEHFNKQGYQNTLKEKEKPYQFFANLGGKNSNWATLTLNTSARNQMIEEETLEQPSKEQSKLIRTTAIGLGQKTRSRAKFIQIQSSASSTKLPLISSDYTVSNQQVANTQEVQESAPETQPVAFAKEILEVQPTQIKEFDQKLGQDLPYPDLFDRSERTLAATFAKYGDLTYFTPTQRIGSYMDFQSRLKRRHLVKLITFMKSQQYQASQNPDEESVEKSTAQFLEQCLFHGLMPNENVSSKYIPPAPIPEVTQENIIPGAKALQVSPLRNVLAYNPLSSQKSLNLQVEKIWSQTLITQVKISINRFLHYINGDFIKETEFSQLKTERVQNALNLIPEHLLNSCQQLVHALFKEILESYTVAIKTAILNYIVRSPDERKRLHIILLPFESLTSAEQQVQNGGFCIKKHQGTHVRKQTALQNIRQTLLNNNIVASQLQAWFSEFRDFSTVNFSNIGTVLRAKNALQGTSALGWLQFAVDPENFFAFQEAHLEKTLALFKHIWYRGAILITKKFKYLKQKGTAIIKGSRWNYEGPEKNEQHPKPQKQEDTKHTIDTSEEVLVSSRRNQDEKLHQYNYRTALTYQNVPLKIFRQENGFLLDSVPQFKEDLLETIQLDDLIDIRENPAYVAYLSYQGGKLNLQEDGYKSLPKDQRQYLKFVAGNLMSLQLHSVIMRSVQDLVDYFTGFPTFETLSKRINLQPLRDMQPMMTDMTYITTDIKTGEQTKTLQNQSILIQNLTYVKDKNFDKDIGAPKLILPDFIQLQDYCNPILHLELVLGSRSKQEAAEANTTFSQLCDNLLFNKTDEQILSDFERLFNSTVTCFNRFLRPEFVKIKQLTQKKYDAEYEEQEMIRVTNTQEDPMRYFQSKTLRQQQNQQIIQALRHGIYPSEFASRINPPVLDFDKQIYSNNFLWSGAYQRYAGRLQIRESNESKTFKQIKLSPQEDKQIKRFFELAQPTEDVFIKKKRKLMTVIRSHLLEVKNVKRVFDQFQSLIGIELKEKIDLFCEKNKGTVADQLNSFQDHLSELNYYHQLALQLPERVAFPLFEVGLSQVKQELKFRIENLQRQLLQVIEREVLRQSKKIIQTFEGFESYLKRDLKNAQDVVSMLNFKSNMLEEMVQLRLFILTQQKCFYFLLTNSYNPDIFKEPDQPDPDCCFTAVVTAFHWPNLINDILLQCEERHYNQKKLIEDDLLSRRSQFDDQLAKITVRLNKVYGLKEFRVYKSQAKEIQMIQLEINNLTEMSEHVVRDEFYLFRIKANNSVITSMKEKFEPHYEMWTVINNHMKKCKIYNEMRLEQIEVEEVDQVLEESRIKHTKLQKIFEFNVNASYILSMFEKEINWLAAMQPVIQCFCNKVLKEQHWKKINEILKSDQDIKVMVLKNVCTLNVDSVIDQLTSISQKAQRESKIEQTLQKMQSYWQGQSFNLVQMKNQKDVMIFMNEQILEFQDVVDEHVVMAQAVTNNPDSNTIIDKALEWQRIVYFLQEILELFSEVQSAYVFLWPVFNQLGMTDEIKRSLRLDDFRMVDQTWRVTLVQIQADPCVLNLKKINNLLEKFDKLINDLEVIKISLAAFLDSKRSVFPRLYFLSDADLIAMLGTQHDPKQVSKTICKSFYGIDNLGFRDQDRFGKIQSEIFEIESREGEKLKLVTTIFPSQFDFSIDLWLMELEKQMRLSVQKVIQTGLSEYPSQLDLFEYRAWLQKWQSQVIILNEQIIWTQKVEQCLKAKNAQQQELRKLYRQQKELLDIIISQIQQPITEVLRLTLQNLLIVKIHEQDTIAQLITKQTDSPQNFMWFSQLRVYLEGQDNFSVRMMLSKLKYEYEYIGVTRRLVITPLTDRCYRTLMSAIVCNLGGAPEGPAGTGKSETIKDLARQVAIPCVVFNGQDGIYSKTMSRFFKGLLQSGCWSCFDEFDRIEIEVLSVIAQQIKEIQNAKSQGVTEFFFEDKQIIIRQTCNIFITMNQAYQGRIPLPDNLKALFRPVAMVLPDEQRICEISLYSVGFRNARELAKKVVAIYAMCIQQCSTQKHYDFGLRSQRAVVDCAVLKKNEYSMQKNRYLLDLDDEQEIILQSIVEVNLPKFVKLDVPNFMGIVQDLFPHFQPQKPDCSQLQNQLENACKTLNFKPKDGFIRMADQLNSLLAVKQGIVIIGSALMGKTSLIRTLQLALQEKEQAQIEIHQINPKSITLSQLFGKFDYISQEYNDGVLCSVFRKCHQSNAYRQWIVLDGPVEATWVENMNTVLDENRKLCLLSGETINVIKTMNVIFETDNLSMTSPATVSRTGIIYMSEDIIGGWKSLLSSWLRTFEQEAKLESIKSELGQEIIHRVTCLIKFLLRPIYRDCVKKLKFIIPITEYQVFINVFKLMQIVTIRPDFVQKIHNSSDSMEGEIYSILDTNFIYSVSMAIGTLVQDTHSTIFIDILNEYTSQGFKSNKPNGENYIFRLFHQAKIPEYVKSVSNLYVENGHWHTWSDHIKKLDNQNAYPWFQNINVSFYDVIVPTEESLMQNYMMKIFSETGNHLMIVGPTGTGKSIAGLHQVINLDQNQFQGTSVAFSAKSTAQSLQEYIEGLLQKQSSKKLAPRFGQKLYIFLDDLNMPAQDKAQCQPPLELLRQWMDYGEWYDIKNKDLRVRKIQDLIFSASIKPATEGSIQVSQRVIRHFSMIGCTLNDKAVHRIFSKIMDWHIKNNKLQTIKLSNTLMELVGASIEVLNFVQKTLKPTPSKFHYQWNLRNLSRVILGMQLMTKIQHTTSKNKILRLWVHEIGRVFGDRLVNNEDAKKIFEILPETVKQFTKENLNEALIELKRFDSRILEPNATPETMTRHIQFSFFAENNEDDGIENNSIPGLQHQDYDEIQDLTHRNKLTFELEKILRNFNQMNKKPLDIVLFEYAQMHLLRIHRVLKMSRGNCLLIGLGGSGRQSLTALAAYSCQLNFVQLEISQDYSVEIWNDDLKRVLIMAGIDDKQSVLLLNEVHLQSGFMLEDINSLLNSGHVHNLFQGDDYLVIREKLRDYLKMEGNVEILKNGTIQQFYEIFCRRVMKNLHIVLCMRPENKIICERLRSFPALVWCCHVDYFQPWPEEALAVVANKFIEEGENLNKEQKEQIVKVIGKVHLEVHTLSIGYLKDTNTKIYVTLTMFLEMIHLFKSLLQRESQKIVNRKNELIVGIEKMETAVGSVTALQDELEQKTPKLEELKRQIDFTIEEMDRERTTILEPKKKEIYQEEIKLNELQMQAQELEDTCFNELKRTEPIIEAATQALSTINQQHINEIKAMQKPPQSVKLVMQAICILMQRPVEKTPSVDNPKQMVENWWYTAQKFLNEKDLIKILIDFNRNNIDQEILNKVKQEFLSDPELRPSRIEKASFAAKGLAEWLFNIEKFDQLNRYIEPKRVALRDAKAQQQSRMADVQAKQEELKQIVHNYEQLVLRLEQEKKALKELEDQIHECKMKLNKANIIINSLGGVMGEWLSLLEIQKKKISTLVCDNLIGAALMTHLAPYPKSYRDFCVQKWLEYLVENKMEVSDFNLVDIYADKLLLRKWNIDGLSADAQSVENAIIVKNYTNKWHLLMDPQNQGNKWVIQTYAVQAMEQKIANNLVVVRPDSQDFRMKLEQAVRIGLTVLIENNSEHIEPFLFPILKKQFYTVSKNNYQIKLGENYIEYNKNFSLIMTSTREEPKFEAEMFTMLSVVNFIISFDALKEQLLNHVVKRENVILFGLCQKINQALVESHQQVKDMQDKIFKVLFKSRQNVLDDDQAVEVLAQSKKIQDQIQEKQRQEAEAEEVLQTSRQVYSSFTDCAALMFLITQKMKQIQPIYQYSLTWFLKYFDSQITNSKEVTISESRKMCNIYIDLNQRRKENIEKEVDSKNSQQIENMLVRVEILVNSFTLNYYQHILRSLFQKDKLMFTFFFAIKLKQFTGKISHVQYDILIQQRPAHENPLQLENPCDWLPQSVWNKLCMLARNDQHHFGAVISHFKADEEIWREIYFNTNQYDSEKDQWPDHHFSLFSKICILKILRPDKVIEYMHQFIEYELGTNFKNPTSFSIANSYNDSNIETPLMFLMPGVDPMIEIERFAKYRNKLETMRVVSLGQGQNKQAENLVQEARKHGHWIVLQNCHLYPSWMPKLEKIIDQIESRITFTHPQFRLWLTTHSSNSLPVSVIQRSIKITDEPQDNLRNHMLQLYNSPVINKELFLEYTRSPEVFKKLAYGLIMFHAVMHQRQRFGRIAFNGEYQFTTSDCLIGLLQLKTFLKEQKNVAFDSLQYLIGECNYGGRVTDSQDRNLLSAFVADFISPNVLDLEYQPIIGTLGKPYAFPDGDLWAQQYLEAISQMPQFEDPQIFGLNQQANHYRLNNYVNTVIKNLIKVGEIDGARQLKGTALIVHLTEDNTGDRSIFASVSEYRQIEMICQDLLKILPESNFDENLVAEIFPFNHKKCLNSFLLQECAKFNILYHKIKADTKALIKVINGDILYTDNLLLVKDSLLINVTPQVWLDLSYPSVNTLVGFATDLCIRMKQLSKWILTMQQPAVFWLPGFFFTEGFLTAVKQSFARSWQYEVQKVDFKITFMNQMDNTNYQEEIFEIDQARNSGFKLHIPINGVLITGLYFECGAWDHQLGCLVEQNTTDIHSKLPILFLQPIAVEEEPIESFQSSCASSPSNKNSTEKPQQLYYKCPLYKTTMRYSTNQNKNFVTFIETPLIPLFDLNASYNVTDSMHWIKRGTAIIMQPTF